MGQLFFFDAVSGLKQKIEFNIDEQGKFQTEFDLINAVYGNPNAYISLEKQRLKIFLKPGERYKVKINMKDQHLSFEGGTGGLNTELNTIQQQIYTLFKSDLNRITLLKEENLSIDDAIKVHQDLEQKMVTFLNDYSKSNTVSEEALTILKMEYQYKTAAARMSLRYGLENGKRKLIKNLPEDFYSKIYDAYPVNATDAWVSRAYLTYISRIGSILASPKKPDKVGSRIKFFKSFNVFSDKELQIIRKVYRGNKDIRKTDEYKAFFNDGVATKIEVLNKKFDVSNLLLNVRQFPKGMGRDLIISQFISRKYFKNTFIQPSAEEWEAIADLVETKNVWNELKRLENVFIRANTQGAGPAYHERPTVESLTKKYLDPHKGKVIYIDFWATWCGPCLREEPYARKLAEKFKNDDVVFLNLCCQSKEPIWRDYVERKNLHGENFLLSREAFKMFAKMYNIKGFPTYVLIDKNGQVSKMDANWPSERKRANRQIEQLLR